VPGEPQPVDVLVVRQDDFYTDLQGLAKLTGLSARTWRKHCTDPVRPLPHFRVGGKWLCRWSEVCAWLEQFRATAVDLDELVKDVWEPERRPTG
jgi:hypothetical protein